MMILLLPLVVPVALIAWLRKVRWIAVALLFAIGIAYAAGLTAISMDPTFEDNGSIEFIDSRYRLVIALGDAGWLTLGTSPLVLLMRAVVVKLTSGTRR